MPKLRIREHASVVRCPVPGCGGLGVYRRTVYESGAEEHVAPTVEGPTVVRTEPLPERRLWTGIFECDRCGRRWPIPDWLDVKAPLRAIEPCPKTWLRRLKPGDEVRVYGTPDGGSRAMHEGHVHRVTRTSGLNGWLVETECLATEETLGRSRERVILNRRWLHPVGVDVGKLAMRKAKETLPEGSRVTVVKGDLRGAYGVVRSHGVSTVEVMLDGHRVETRFFPDELRLAYAEDPVLADEAPGKDEDRRGTYEQIAERCSVYGEKPVHVKGAPADNELQPGDVCVVEWEECASLHGKWARVTRTRGDEVDDEVDFEGLVEQEGVGWISSAPRRRLRKVTPGDLIMVKRSTDAYTAGAVFTVRRFWEKQVQVAEGPAGSAERYFVDYDNAELANCDLAWSFTPEEAPSFKAGDRVRWWVSSTPTHKHHGKWGTIKDVGYGGVVTVKWDVGYRPIERTLSRNPSETGVVTPEEWERRQAAWEATQAPIFKVGDCVRVAPARAGQEHGFIVGWHDSGEVLVRWVGNPTSTYRENPHALAKIDPPRHSGWTRNLVGDPRIVPGATVLPCHSEAVDKREWKDWGGLMGKAARVRDRNGCATDGACLVVLEFDGGRTLSWRAKDCIFVCGPDEGSAES